MFEINPYMTSEVYLRQSEKGHMEFCEEGNGVAMTYAILHLQADGGDWAITKIELTTEANYQSKHRDQRHAQEITGALFEQAKEFFTNSQSQSWWIDRYVREECDSMGGREYDKYQHEAV